MSWHRPLEVRSKEWNVCSIIVYPGECTSINVFASMLTYFEKNFMVSKFHFTTLPCHPPHLVYAYSSTHHTIVRQGNIPILIYRQIVNRCGLGFKNIPVIEFSNGYHPCAAFFCNIRLALKVLLQLLCIDFRGNVRCRCTENKRFAGEIAQAPS